MSTYNKNKEISKKYVRSAKRIPRSEESHFGDSLPFMRGWFTRGDIESIQGQIELNIRKLLKIKK